ncbi:tape measure protein [Leuconostoc mesenteroides]|uniref:tape measure protein n=1 Tax=Leuconostoc mesenteroides TaxID=1245 RepID=UPI000A033B7A|nr:tape measure protein [Leuconostoc mesenteroides]ORI39637.1 hypothetical protein BMR90_00920 [Leuconostoc mesenteroides subsp. cremoris]ORI42506.1 hypothetical protein BMR91_00905 [Leuconostoc mesenteroides subsp. cremoris]ORI44583.1 hypothetical protein BMR93_01710 [Leuconostoc mesenteroides subsp. cremoris]
MAKQIVNEMATNLTLDSKSASQALKELTREVKNSSTEAKILESQYKASGDTLNASKAKYEGLQTTIEKQKDKVDDLKQALENNNTTTKKGQELQTYLTNELAKAERQYASYNGQLAKAEQAYKYQESGLAKLNEEVKHGNDLTDARVKKLEAEGNKEEAQKVKLDNLKSSNEKYNQMLTIQKNELNKLSESGDKNSDAYKRQQLRVEQMGAKVAETTRDIKRFNETDIKPETRGLNHVKEQLSSLNQSLEGTRSHFKNIFLGNLVANGVTNALEGIKEKLSETLQGAQEYNKEQQVMNATWTTLTDSASKGKEMVGSINQISTAFGQSNDVVNELSQQFYHVFNQKEPTDQLTKSMLTMADTLGMNGEQVERLGLNFTHMMSSTKLQLGDFNMITDQLPMYGEKLLEYERKVQNNSKLTMAELRNQMSAGKISAKDATEVMNELGDKYKSASENMMGTASGMERVMSARGKALAGSLIQPIMNAQNPIFSVVSKWVSDPKTEQEFGKVGQSISKAFGTITSAFGKEFKGSDFTGGANKFMDNLAKSIEKFGDYVAKHKDDIISFFKAMKSLAGSGFGTLGVTLKIALPLLEQLGKFAQEHPKTFKILAGTIVGADLALKGLIGTMAGLGKIGSAFSFAKGLIIKPKVEGSDAKRELGILGKAGKGIGKAFWWTGKLAVKTVLKSLELIGGAVIKTGKAMLWTAKLAWSSFKKSLTALGTAAKVSGKAIGKGLKFTASIATKGAKLAMAGLVKSAQATGKGLKLAFNFLKANPFILIITGIVAVVAAFVELYKHNKKFREFVNNLVKSAKELYTNVVRWFEKLWDNITDIFNGIKKTVTKVFNSVANFISDTLKFIYKSWTSVWNSISDFFGGIWRSISKLSSNTINAISSTIANVLGGIGSTWRSVWGGLSSFFGGIWKDIKGFAQDGINGVLSVINAGVNGIDSVWKFFTGHETSIHHLNPVRFEQGGIVQQRLAMVNDGAGEHWKELIQLPNGEMKILQQRNAVMALPVGTRVYNGKETKAIMSMAGIEKYANGGVVGSAIDWTKGALSDVGGWIGDKMDAITSFLKSPLSAVKSLISKATSGIISGMGNFGQLATGTWDKLANSVAEWFTKGLKKVQDEDGGSGKGAPSGAGVSRWRSQVVDALKANGLSTSSGMVNKVLRQIQTESGGNEKAVQGNIGDINNKTGDLAKGLMQVITSTFNANKFPGHNNPFNGYDSLLAGLNYAKKTYGSNLSFLGQGHGYENGGLITKHQIAEIGEGNQPEMIIPLSSMKTSRGYETLGQAVVAMASRDGLTGSSATSDSSTLEAKIEQGNQLLNSMVQLLAGILGQTTKANQSVDDIAMNKFSKAVIARAVRSAN